MSVLCQGLHNQICMQAVSQKPHCRLLVSVILRSMAVVLKDLRAGFKVWLQEVGKQGWFLKKRAAQIN